MKMTVGIIVLGMIAMVNQDFAALLGMSIMCTLGASLLVWLPIAWVIGAVLTAFIPTGDDGGKVPLTPAQQQLAALTTFYTDAKTKGLSTKEIQEVLIEAGWTEDYVVPFLMKVDPTAY